MSDNSQEELNNSENETQQKEAVPTPVDSEVVAETVEIKPKRGRPKGSVRIKEPKPDPFDAISQRLQSIEERLTPKKASPPSDPLADFMRRKRDRDRHFYQNFLPQY